MQPHDWLWTIPAVLSALNAWQNANIRTAVLSLKIELADRIARAEGDIKELRALLTHAHHGE